METNKQIEYVGPGTISKVSEILEQFGSKRIFLVTGNTSFASCGAEEGLADAFSGREVFRFVNFHENPDIDGIVDGIAKFKEFKPDVVIAVGGGSAMDTAKAINALAFQSGNPRDYISGTVKISEKSLPLIAIPTTSGTGSESTHFAVVYMDHVKYSLADEKILPTAAIVDANLTTSLSKSVTATSGADALCQAVESFWSVNATNESKKYSKRALELALNNLESAVNSPDEASRNAMSESAHLAGQAINISKTTAAHALSYPFTAHFGITHGNAVAIMLPAVMRFNGEISGLADLVTPEKLEEIFKSIGFEMKLSAFGVKESDLDRMLDEASLERMKNNPREVTREDARGILESVL